MGSTALEQWRGEAAVALAEIEQAHRAVGGSGPGRRSVTQQLNYAYVLLLAARFQGFARALHTEIADEIAGAARSADYGRLVLESLTHQRRLDRGNAQPDGIAEDYGRFGMALWASVDATDARNVQRRAKLRDAMAWRNAIAHHDIDGKLAASKLTPTSVGLRECRIWRSALDGLAVSIDRVAADQCEALGIARPW